MKNRFKKMLMLMTATVLLAGTASDVAYAHSYHHSSRTTAAVCYATCYQDGICTQNGTCDVNGICQNSGYCVGTSYCEGNTICIGSHYSGYNNSLSTHHAERGHRSHH